MSGEAIEKCPTGEGGTYLEVMRMLITSLRGINDTKSFGLRVLDRLAPSRSFDAQETARYGYSGRARS